MIKFIQKFRILPLLLVAVILCFIWAHPVLAADTSIGASMNKLGITAFAGFFSMIIILIALLSIIVAILLGDLMTSFYIFDTGMGDTLYLVWEIMRNFVNIVFIIALLIIAVRVVFGIGESGGTGFLKKILPKFIIALVAVNLTFFAARFVIGTADVLATAVFALPKSVVGEKMIRGVPCPDTYKNFQASRIWEAGKCSEEVQKIISSGASDKNIADKEASEFGDMLKNVANATSVNVKIQELATKENFALVLLMNILRLDDLLWLKSVGGSWQTFLVGGLGSIIMAGAVAIVYFMLFVAFLIRVVMLWIMIPLMPLGVLAMVMKDVIPGMPEAGGGTFSLKGFISTAFMPVFVAFPLSVGMIMIFGNNAISSLDGVSIVSLDVFTKHFNVILWWAASIGVIWIGTKEAIKMGNEVAGKFTESIHNKVNGTVGAIANTAKYLPIFPSLGTGSNLTADAILRQPELFADDLRTKSNTKAGNLASDLGYGPSTQAVKLREFTETTNHAKQKELINDPEVRSGLVNQSTSPESREAVFTHANITLSPADKAKLSNVSEFKKLLDHHKDKINTHYGNSGLVDAIKNATPAATTPEATTPAGTKVENGTKDAGTHTVYLNNNNHIIYNNKNEEVYNLENLSAGLKPNSTDDEINKVAADLEKATELLSSDQKKKWIEQAGKKFGTDAAGIAKKKILEDALK